MARKSNKTAHVLNLLSGQDTGDETEKEPAAAEPETAVKTEPAAPAEAPSPAASAPAAPQPEVPSNISIIANGTPKEDPVAERIREELLKNLDPEEASIPDPEPAAKEEELPKSAQTPEPEPQQAEMPAPEKALAEVPAAESQAPAEEKNQEPEKAAPAQEEPEEPEEEILELSEETPPEPKPAPQPEPPAEPEPDYVMVNVMQRIVEDKIIYFMKQFEVCTCHRCKTDTIALTLSGLPAKYMVMDKHAVDPMISFLTGRLISQITVEALKACTQVKEHPRHKPEE